MNGKSNGHSIDVKFDLNLNDVDYKENRKNKSSHRTRLPATMIDRSQISIWSILKQSIGKELSKIAMPAAWCEPLSFLQRITENIAYSELISKASEQIDSCKRMEYISAFAVSCISNNVDRLSKPFNPLLGETYELTRDDLGFRVICEQVSHHPPVSAFHADSLDNENKWQFYGTVNPKLKFWGKSIEALPRGLLTLQLPKHKETYTWQAVTCCVHNIIVGKLWFEYYGTMEIVCHQSGYKAVINFKPYSWSNRELHKVEGFIYDNKKNKVKALYGYWTHCLYSCDVDLYENYTRLHKDMPTIHIDDCLRPKLQTSKSAGRVLSETKNSIRHNHSDSEIGRSNEDCNSEDCPNRQNEVESSSASLPSNSAILNECLELWRAKPMPDYSSDYYNFNYFAMCLNEMKHDHKGVIAPTDTRYRTDIRELENGDLDAAAREKLRLEEKQRETRKLKKDEFKPKWFQLSKSPINGEEIWLFNEKYWLREYHDCPNLY